MKKWILRIVYAALVLFPIGAIADYTATQGAGTTVFAFVCSVSKICPATVLIDSSNVEKATAGNPLRTDPTGTTTQPVSAAALPLPTGAATSALQSTINTTLGTPMQNSGGSVIANIGTVGTLSTAANQSSQITQETATAAALGTTADAPCTLPATTTACSQIAVAKASANATNSAIPAGSAIIGKVGIDQTTPGTTNGVQVNAALPAGTNLIGKTGIDQTTPGTTNAVSVQYGSTASVADPCQTAAKVYTPINVVTATNTIITGVAAKKKYICGIFLYPAGADNIAIFQATTATSCATALVGVIGGTTTATGIVATAQAGFVLGNGASAVAATTVNQTDLCIVTSAAVQLSGVIVTVDQ